MLTFYFNNNFQKLSKGFGREVVLACIFYVSVTFIATVLDNLETTFLK